jgi:serine/threonine protein kinase
MWLIRSNIDLRNSLQNAGGVVSAEVPEVGDASLGGNVAGFGADSRIAGYRPEQRIGAGGMAMVFRARDERLGRLVALKILTPELAADNQFRQRFIRESQTAAAVDHPNIIPVFEAGEAGGMLFLAMRYVPGGDVRSLLSRAGPRCPRLMSRRLSPRSPRHWTRPTRPDSCTATSSRRTSWSIRSRGGPITCTWRISGSASDA